MATNTPAPARTSTSTSNSTANTRSQSSSSAIIPPRGQYKQGMVLLMNFAHPDLVENEFNGRKIEHKIDDYYLYVKNARPVVVVSKGDDQVGNMVVVPLTTVNKDYYIQLMEPYKANLNSPSYAKVTNISSIHIKETVSMLGYMSENDLNKILMSVYRLF